MVYPKLVPDRMWPDLKGGTGAVRVYGAARGGAFFVVPFGVKRGVVMGPRRASTFDVIDPMTGEVLDRMKLGAGRRFELAGRELFVLRGRFE